MPASSEALHIARHVAMQKKILRRVRHTPNYDMFVGISYVGDKDTDLEMIARGSFIDFDGSLDSESFDQFLSETVYPDMRVDFIGVSRILPVLVLGEDDEAEDSSFIIAMGSTSLPIASYIQVAQMNYSDHNNFEIDGQWFSEDNAMFVLEDMLASARDYVVRKG